MLDVLNQPPQNCITYYRITVQVWQVYQVHTCFLDGLICYIVHCRNPSPNPVPLFTNHSLVELTAYFRELTILSKNTRSQ